MAAPISQYHGQRVLILSTGLENPLEGVLIDIKMEPQFKDVGQWCYEIELESGEHMLIPVTDLCYIVLKKERHQNLTTLKIPD